MGTTTESCINDLIEAKRRKKYETNRWSYKEHILRLMSEKRDPFLTEHAVTFKIALLVLLRRTMFGTFLKCFNRQQTQDHFLNRLKMDVLNFDLKRFSAGESRKFFERNLPIEGGYLMLVEAVSKCDVIDLDFLYENLETLRLSNVYINTLDGMARNFENLQVLILCCNWLQNIPRQKLPRRLKYLELYGNQIDDLETFTKKGPKGLLYVGLGRNKLTDKSKIHLLARPGIFDQLRCIDLSDNDIYDLLTVVQSLSSLQQLSSLQLEGNPCSVCESYKDVIFKFLPNLLYLDNTEPMEQDKIIADDLESGSNRAALIFTCHRIMGLPPPPKQKGITPTIHLEIILPLMEEITEEAEVEDEIEETETEMKPEKDNLTPKTGKVKKGKGGKNSPYAALDEYALELRNKIKDKSFKTEKLSWAKVLQFPDDAIIVEPPHNDLKAVRDTFRSIIKVKVVYLETGLEGHKKEARKGGKKGKKGKKAKDKDPKKKNRKDKNKKEKQVTTTSATSTEKVEVEKPQEVILKKVTLARFDCELHDINWSDRTIDFYWADHPDANPKAIPVEGSLRAVQYAGDPSTKQSDGDVSRKKTTLPQLFTCQVGFGLSRL